MCFITHTNTYKVHSNKTHTPLAYAESARPYYIAGGSGEEKVQP